MNIWMSWRYRGCFNKIEGPMTSGGSRWGGVGSLVRDIGHPSESPGCALSAVQMDTTNNNNSVSGISMKQLKEKKSRAQDPTTGSSTYCWQLCRPRDTPKEVIIQFSFQVMEQPESQARSSSPRFVIDRVLQRDKNLCSLFLRIRNTNLREKGLHIGWCPKS